ncbi:uncharacterized protein LOC122026726 [Zingiber officinale]|uniref:uncharacterized protein LOC122026726 n=1 Tax=Zingiber officinale TaxID=94328 RepID=UPI001C4AD9DF|nr:uncharacterized protein LOC122026726 [Zingiber officinale]
MADKLLKDYGVPYARGVQFSITRPPIEANNFEIKPAVNGVPPELVRLLLFGFSLKDRAQQWLNSLPTNSISSWEQSGGALINKRLDDAEEIIENVAQNHHQLASERSSNSFTGNPIKASGKFNVDAVTLMSAKMDILTKKFEAMGNNTANAIACVCDTCGSTDHAQDTCPFRLIQAQMNQLEQCDAIASYNQR